MYTTNINNLTWLPNANISEEIIEKDSAFVFPSPEHLYHSDKSLGGGMPPEIKTLKYDFLEKNLEN